MIVRRALLLFAAVLLLATACGDGDSSETTSATTSPPSSTEAAPTTSASTTVPPTTTTAPPTTTTVPPTTTTQPPGLHTEADILWDDMLPGPEAVAVYRVDMVAPDTPMSHQWGVAGDLEARMEYGVEWFGRDGTYDRLAIGLNPIDTPGLVFYFQLDDPWVVDFLGMEAWAEGNVGRGPSALETLAEAATLDLSGGVGRMFRLDGFVTAVDSFGIDELDASIAVTLRDADAGPVTVAAGTFEQAMLYEILLSGPIVGGPDFTIEIMVSPGNLILEMSMPGAAIELLEPWS